jgi:hypothetical protein
MKPKHIAITLGLVPFFCMPAQSAVSGSSKVMHDLTSDRIVLAQGTTGSGGGSGPGTDIGGGSPGSGTGATESTTGSGKGSMSDFRKAPPCDIKDGDAARKAEQAEAKGTHMIEGEVMRIEDESYLVREQSGKEVTLKTDKNTNQPVIHQGDDISASVDNQNYALWVRSNKETDRRTEHASADCTPN